MNAVRIARGEWPRPSRLDFARPENRGQSRLRGAQPDDPARRACVAAHRLAASPAIQPASTIQIVHQRLVERFFAWLGRNRRLARDVEATVASATAFLYTASAMLLICRPARSG